MKNRQSAFTLLEIMLVVAIIGVLLSAAIYKMANSIEVARETKTRGDIQAFRTMLLTYNGTNGYYPSTDQGLNALIPKLIEDLPKDGWGSPYIYRCPGGQIQTATICFPLGTTEYPTPRTTTGANKPSLKR